MKSTAGEVLFQLPSGRVYLTLAFFAWFFEMSVFTEIGKNPGFFTLFLESFQSLFKRLAFINKNFRHATTS